MSSNQSYSEKDITTNLLITLKHMKSEYNTFLQEASNETLYSDIMQVYTCISEQQRNVFELMCQQSWYKMTPDTPKNISNAYSKYSKSESELS